MHKLLTGVCLALSSTAAFAADVPSPTADIAVVEEFSWTGFYVGAHGGYASGDLESTSGPSGALVGPPIAGFGDADVDGLPAVGDPASALIDLITGEAGGFESDGDVDGALAGGQFGYNWQLGNIVFGLEADISWSDVDGDAGDSATDIFIGDPDLAADLAEDLTVDDFVGNAFAGTASLDVALQTDINWLATVRGRIGGAFDRVFVYATGGVAFADTEVVGLMVATAAGQTYTDEDLADFTREAGVSSEADDVMVGYAIGAGVEVALSEHWSVKAEYNYIDLGDIEVDYAGEDAVIADIDIDLHVAKVGVNYRF